MKWNDIKKGMKLKVIEKCCYDVGTIVKVISNDFNPSIQRVRDGEEEYCIPRDYANCYEPIKPTIRDLIEEK